MKPFPFAQAVRAVQLSRWPTIVIVALAPFAVSALGAGTDAFALTAILSGIALILATLYFFFTDPPSESAPEFSLNAHPRHGVLVWAPSTARHAVQVIATYVAMIVCTVVVLRSVPDDWSAFGGAFDGAYLRGAAAMFIVIAATAAPLELLGAVVVRRWGKSPPPKTLALWLLGGGALAWFTGSLTSAFLTTMPPLLSEKAKQAFLPQWYFDWAPELLIAAYVVAMWHRRGQVSVWQARIETAEKGRRLAEAQLAMLQAQVEPHFLYNTLASVQYLVRKDAASADFLLTQLIRYLRSAMPKLRSSMSTLGQEFELADAYLQIARMRMGDRLTVSVELAESLHQTPFPPLVLQTLVENALKHGVEPKIGPVHITVQASRLEGRLDVVVEDDGVGLPRPGEAASTAGSGTGLANIRDRLAGIYDGHARLTVSQRSMGGVRSTVTVDLLATAGGAQADTADPHPIAPLTQET